MRIKRKNGLKVAAITIALLLCLALAVGITGAFYQAKRQATGTLSMDQGIIIDYKGFGKTPDEGIWSRENKTTFLLFDETNAQPGQNIPVNTAGIRANEKSVNFYARLKLDYKFYNVVKSATEGGQEQETKTPVELADATKLIKTSSSFFGTNWVDGGSSDGYYYYATGSTLKKFEKGTQTFVDLFATDAKFVIEGEGFTLEDGDLEGGGFVVGDTSINKIEVYLTLETLQGDATAEQAKALGWEITTGGTEGENVVELNPGDYTLTTIPDERPGEEKTIYTPSETFVEKNPKYAFTFSLDETDNTAAITGYVGSPTELVVPSKISIKSQGYTTTSIGDYAFKTYKGLTSIKIPKGVTTIGDYAFYGCSGLKSINIPDSVTTIGFYAFMYCSGLTSIKIPNRVTRIGSGAFFDCSSLTSITIPNSVESIRDDTFKNCTSLISITIPEGVTSIGDHAFRSCSKLTEITIPKTVTSIEKQPFYDCIGLEKIKVAEGNVNYHSAGNCLIETASKTLILGCKNSEIPSGGSVTSIGNDAFYNCSGLTSITIPDSVTSIGNDAFQYCSGLESINIPHRVTSIGDGAFAGCTGLTTITIKAINPPTLSSSAIPDVQTIYVPSESVEAYKAANSWKNFAARIRAIA